MYYRPILIVGHPRCGTGYAANLLGQLGLDIGHETEGKDGVSTWMFAAEDDAPYAQAPVAQRRTALVWKNLIMPVRDINTAIPSIMHHNIFAPLSYQYRRKHIENSFGIDLNKLESNFARAVCSYIYWNEMILNLKPDLIFRIELDHEKVQQYIFEHFFQLTPSTGKIDLRPRNSDNAYQGKQYNKPDISPHDWSSLPEALWNGVVLACDRFGYDVPARAVRSHNNEPQPTPDLAGLNNQFLRPSGWARSYVEERPVHADGAPLPWFTYGAIEFLSRTVRANDRVFEYGAGYSTLWWQDRVRAVVSVEHDAAWCAKIDSKLLDNVTLINIESSSCISERARFICKKFFGRMRRTYWPNYSTEKIARRGLDDESFQAYAASILSYEDDFDIIVIDGMARRLCAAFAIEKISLDGVIVLDNSNRRDYDTAYDLLQEAGFSQIPFWGLVPGATFMTCTSVFVRSLDRLAPASHAENTLMLPEY